jgi:hypothetical protein
MIPKFLLMCDELSDKGVKHNKNGRIAVVTGSVSDFFEELLSFRRQRMLY